MAHLTVGAVRERVGVAGLTLALLVVNAVAVRAQPATATTVETPREARVTGVALLHDNDGLPNAGNTFRDDNYSAGLAVRVSGRLSREGRLTAPLEGLDRLTGVSRRHRRGATASHALVLFGAAFTPNDLVATEPQREDRPFASLVGLTVRRQSVRHDRDVALTSELTLGVLGLGAAQDIQSLLHRTRRWMTGSPAPPDPRGWPNQISNGGEPTGLYRVAVDRRLAGAASGVERKHWQMTGGLEASAGFHTTVAGTLALRAGTFSSEFWESASGIVSPALGRQAPVGERRWEAFVFGGARPRLVAYNALLQGQFRRSVHTVRPRRVIGEWEAGVGFGVPAWSYQLQLSIGLAQGRSTEWVGERATPSTWGTVAVAVSRPGR